jgi:hypothetical protein
VVVVEAGVQAMSKERLLLVWHEKRLHAILQPKDDEDYRTSLCGREIVVEDIDYYLSPNQVPWLDEVCPVCLMGAGIAAVKLEWGV